MKQSTIFQLIEEGDLIELKSTLYESEDLLQTLLENHPSLLAGDLISEPPRRWILIEREAGIPDTDGGSNRWSVDHVLIDQEGIPTLIEVKRSADTRIRREVVGQMLDYAANVAAFWSLDRLIQGFEETCSAKGVEPEDILLEHLNADDIESAGHDFWQSVKTNLDAGRLRLLFVADEIPRELQRIVEFLNSQMDRSEVLAIELAQYVGGGKQTIVPRIFGKTSQSERAKSIQTSTGTEWDYDRFLAALEEQSEPDGYAVVKSVLDWALEEFPEHQWGKGSTWGTIAFTTTIDGRQIHPFSLQTRGKIQLRIKKLQQTLPDEQHPLIEQWLEDMSAVFDDYEFRGDKEPAFTARLYVDNVAEFKDAMSRFIATLADAARNGT